ncbi:amino acid adenylation domain-containing protein [Roseovarius sp. S1116L3]|uniref:amino acid adenylation domain-containing protein n=1 Tax=Roseovarius roseus TaxID=3342636 RepID=UPI003729A2F7
MSVLAGQNPDRKKAQPVLASLPHAQAEDADSHCAMLEAFGGLWANGYPVDWTRLDEDRIPSRRVTGMPTYPFQRKRFWVEPFDTASLPTLESQPQAMCAQDEPATASALLEGPRITAAAALRDMLSDLSGIDPSEMAGEARFLELGFDSLLLTQATRELSERFGVTVTLRQLIDTLATIDALAAHVEEHGNMDGKAPSDRTPLAEMTRIDEPPARSDADREAAPSSAPMTRIARDADKITPAQRAHIDQLTARYTAKTAKSKELTAHYRPFHADPRTASGFNQLWKDIVYQIVTVKSKGSRLIDVDGNEYIDILNGFGPGFLGHSPDLVVKAVEEQLHAGFEVGPQSLAAMEASQLFCEVTGNDRASFVCTGSEAVYAAMRLARTVTSRDRIVMFARDYHGNFDEVLVRGIDSTDGPRTLPLAPGIPRDSVKNVIVLPYGTPQALDYIRRNADSLAAVIVEPVQSRRPELRPTEFIREVRCITEKSGSLFIFDEVVTGFRFGPRGAQGFYGVKADLVTYGKVVGGGMPIGVVSGQARYMDTFDGGIWNYGDDSFPDAPVTFFAGTFVRHPLAMASLKAMLTYFKSQPDFFWKTVAAKGDRVAGTLDKWFADNDFPFQMPNCGSLMYLRIGEDQKFGALLGAHLRDRGVFMLEGFPSYMTASHDDEDMDHIIAAMQDSALELRSAGMLTGREAVMYDGPVIDHAPPRLSLPGGEAAIAAAMRAPLGILSVPTTEAQREIWAAMIVTPEVVPAYNESVTLKLVGPIDRAALIKAVTTGLHRHDALRSTFSADGMTMHIHPDLDVDVPLVDLTGKQKKSQENALKTLLDEHVETPFNMVSGQFVRAHLVAFSPDDHHLIITAHHIVCDGWSIDVIMSDISKLYTALTEKCAADLPPVQSIIDYARAEADWERSDAFEEDRAYWLEKFQAPDPALDLPTDRPRAAARTVAARRLDRALDSDLTVRLRKTASRQGVTLVNLLLAVFNLHLARVTGADAVTVGVPAAGQASRGMAGVVGHCVNLMPLRSRIDRAARFSDYVADIRSIMLEGSEHQHFSFGMIVRQLCIHRDPARVPLTPVMFNIDNGIDLSNMRFGTAEAEFISNPRAFENFEIFLNMTIGREIIQAEWTYNTHLFDEATMIQHMAGLTNLLGRIAGDPDATLAELLALSTEEATALKEAASGPAHDYPAKPLHQLVADQAAVSPGSIAVECAGKSTTYAELDASANRIAATLIARGVKPGDRVGVALNRDARLIEGLLGVLKTGAAYLPLDPAFPADRLGYMIRDCDASYVLVDATTKEVFTDIASGASLLDLDEDSGLILAQDKVAPNVATDPEALAYVLYTSGSTGMPKGVAIQHCAFVNFISSMAREPGLKPGARMLALTTVSFDIAGLELWGPLITGGTVVMARRDDAADGTRLKILLEADISIMQATPSTWRMLIDSGWTGTPALTALVGGEAVPADLVGELLTRCGSVWNMYGPTETTVWSTLKKISGARVTIGRPIANTEIRILDADMNPVPPGVPGELMIGGDSLALGYFGQKSLTAEKFIAHPARPNARLYRTGDLARWVRIDDGYEIECLGRTDNQIKLRGYRIELGEIEAALSDHPDVKQAAVLLKETGPGDTRLIAYFVAEAGCAPSSRSLRAHLAARLPDYMVPSRFETVATVPLTPNGKIDRKTLSMRELTVGTDALPSSGGTQERLLAIFREVLVQNEVAPDDDFFEMGGHSLLTVKLFAEIRRSFGVDMPIAALFGSPTARSLAARIEDTMDEADAGSCASAGTVNDAPWDMTAVINSGPDDGNEAALFIIGGVGGNVNNLYELGKMIGETRQVIGFQTRGVHGHSVHATIEAMAADNIHYLRQHQPLGPYHLAGYSGGAFTALEMARQLEAMGETVAHFLILDAPAPGFAVDFDPDVQVSIDMRLRYEWTKLCERGVGHFLKRASSKFRKVTERGPLMPVLRHINPSTYRYCIMEKDWRTAASGYRGGPFGGNVTLLKSRPERLIDIIADERDPSYGWADICTADGQPEVILVRGGHLAMLKG